MSGGVEPAGNCLRRVCEIAVTCALAISIFVPGWKKTLVTDTPKSAWLSMCSMPFTVVVRARSKFPVKRCSMSSGGKPPYCQTTAITGMLISGRMSVGIWRMEKTPATTISIAMTTKV